MDQNTHLIGRLNQALALEMRASVMYAHYASYVKGIHRLHLKPYFETEATESFNHANVVRDAINRLGGVAVTERDAAEIAHSTDYNFMLNEALKAEQMAAQTYNNLLELAEDDKELYDAIEQIYLTEVRSIEELTQLL